MKATVPARRKGSSIRRVMSSTPAALGFEVDGVVGGDRPRTQARIDEARATIADVRRAPGEPAHRERQIQVEFAW
jgi:hypothetical protein